MAMLKQLHPSLNSAIVLSRHDGRQKAMNMNQSTSRNVEEPMIHKLVVSREAALFHAQCISKPIDYADQIHD